MSIPPISSIGDAGNSLIARLAPMQAPMADLEAPSTTIAPTGGMSSGGFGDMLTRAVKGVADQATSAERLQEMAASGQLPDPTVAIVETQKADLSLRLALQVRNKLIEGWTELTRMPV